MKAVLPLVAALAASSTMIGASGAAANAAPSRTWSWTAPQRDRRPVLVKLVRGSLKVVRRPGPLKIVVRTVSASGNPGAVRYEISDRPGAITLLDRYPAESPFGASECRSTLDERGNFEDSDILSDAIVFAREGQSVRAEIMDQRSAK